MQYLAKIEYIYIYNVSKKIKKMIVLNCGS